MGRGQLRHLLRRFDEEVNNSHAIVSLKNERDKVMRSFLLIFLMRGITENRFVSVFLVKYLQKLEIKYKKLSCSWESPKLGDLTKSRCHGPLMLVGFLSGIFSPDRDDF